MATSYYDLIEMFFHRIEKDRDFFNYFSLSDEEAMEIAETRAQAYLEEAVARIQIECHPTVDFSDRGDDEFNWDLNDREKLLVTSLMYEYYLGRDISYLKLQNVNYTSTDLRVFDPSNWRLSFMEMYESVRAQNAELLDIYKNTSRETGEYLALDFSRYDTGGE